MAYREGNREQPGNEGSCPRSYFDFSVVHHFAFKKKAGEPRDVSARPWKEPAVSPIMATDEIRWTLLLQQSQSILGQLVCLREHCDVGLR